MSEYLLEEVSAINAEQIIAETDDIKDLLNIEFTETEHNIILFKKIIVILYNKINTLENIIKNRGISRG